MGVDFSAKVIVGLPYPEAKDAFNALKGLDEDNEEAFEDYLDSGDLDYASPWYDASPENWIVGIELGEDELNDEDINSAKQTFKHIVGVDASIHITPDVY